MNKYIYIICLVIVYLNIHCVYAENEYINIRLIQVEESLKSLEKRVDWLKQEMDRRFDEMDRRFNDIDRRFNEIDRRFYKIGGRFDSQQVFNYFIIGGIFTIITLICTLMGMIIWDRRTTLKPVLDDIVDIKKLKDKVIALYNHLGLDYQGAQQLKPI